MRNKFVSIIIILLFSTEWSVISGRGISAGDNYLAIRYQKTLGISQKREVSDIALSPDGAILASVSSGDKYVKFWNREGKIDRLGVGHTHYSVHSAAFSPDGKILASGSGDRTVRIWNREGEMLRVLKGHSGPVTSIAFSPDGKHIASGSADNTIIVQDLDGKVIHRLRGHTGTIRDICYSPEGSILASASADRDIRLWNPGTGRIIRTLKRHTGWVSSVEFSPDGKYLLSASHDKTFRIWNRNGRLIRSVRKFTHPVETAAFSPDGRFIATGSSDYYLRIWTPEGKLLYSVKAHRGSINRVIFSADGSLLISASDDARIKLWEIAGLRITATSELEPSGKFSYTAVNILDGSLGTAWVEGKRDDGVGESISVAFPEVKKIHTVRIVNGLASGKYWKMNNRIKKLIISTDKGGWFETELKDADTWQSLLMPDGFKGKKVTFFIGSVYRGTKRRDTAISEVEFDFRK